MSGKICSKPSERCEVCKSRVGQGAEGGMRKNTSAALSARESTTRRRSRTLTSTGHPRICLSPTKSPSDQSAEQ